MAEHTAIYLPTWVTPECTLLEGEFLAKRNPDPEYGKDRYTSQAAFSKTFNIKDQIELYKKTIADCPDLDASVASLPISDGDESGWSVTKGMYVIKPKSTKNKPRLVGDNNQDIDPEIIENGMKVYFQVTPFTFKKSKTVQGITFSMKMVKVMTQKDYTPIGSANEAPEDVFKDI